MKRFVFGDNVEFNNVATVIEVLWTVENGKWWFWKVGFIFRFPKRCFTILGICDRIIIFFVIFCRYYISALSPVSWIFWTPYFLYCFRCCQKLFKFKYIIFHFRQFSKGSQVCTFTGWAIARNASILIICFIYTMVSSC